MAYLLACLQIGLGIIIFTQGLVQLFKLCLREFSPTRKENQMSEPMTPEQIKNFREALCLSLGPYALIMPEEQVVKMRDKFQRLLNPGLLAEEKVKTEEVK